MKFNFGGFMSLLRISVVILSVLGLLSVAAFVSTNTHASLSSNSSIQNKVQIENDLKKFFRKSSLVWFDSTQAERQVRENGGLSFTAKGKNWEIILTPNDLRAPVYRAEKTIDGGVRVPAEMNKVNTYKGNVVGLSNSDARFTISEKGIESVIFTTDENFYLEPASRYSKEASSTDFVFYSANDLINTEVGVCGVGLHEKIEHAKREYLPKTAESISSLLVADIATEADYQYVSFFGGSAQANNEILSILNVVQSVYERELNLRLRIVYQHTWDTPAQPYSGTNPDQMLQQFKSHWDSNFSNINRDLAHFWTGRPMDNFYGYSYISSVCNPHPTLGNVAYGISRQLSFVPNKFYLTAHEIGHNFGATHSDGQAGCSLTIMESAIHYLATSFCQFSRDQIANHVATYSGCLSAATKTRFDYDGDNKADTTVYRPNGGLWFIQNSSNNSVVVTSFGLSSDRVVPEDYDGDGKTDIAVWRPSTGVWYTLNSSDGNFKAVSFGLSTDVPAPADFDGDNKSDIVVFRPGEGTWYLLLSRDGFSARAFGANGDVPVSADYDADGKADTAVFRPSNGVWYVQNSSNNAFTVRQFGMQGDKPIGGDFDGDGKADLNVFRPSTNVWYNLFSIDGSFRAYQFGLSADQPSAADYDGDGKVDITVFRPSTGVWYFIYSSNNNFAAKPFGTNGDIAAPSAYVP
jgi:hypothetical protein